MQATERAEVSVAVVEEAKERGQSKPLWVRTE
jgi:hypothetical protein